MATKVAMPLAAYCLLCSILQAQSNPVDLAEIEQAFVKLAEHVSPSVVAIESHSGASDHEPLVGSGVIIDPAGFIVTNDHVIRDAHTIDVILDGGRQLRQLTVERRGELGRGVGGRRHDDAPGPDDELARWPGHLDAPAAALPRQRDDSGFEQRRLR